MALNFRQERFVVEYIAINNATTAAINAGYSENGAGQTGHNLLKHPEISAEIERRKTAINKRVLGRYEVTRERIVEELAKLALSNAADFTSFDEAGNPVTDFSEVTRDQMAAVQEVTSEVYVEGRGDDAERVKRTKFKLYDKRAALMDLAKLEGHVVDRQQLTGANGGPIQTVSAHVVSAGDLTPETRAKLRDALQSMHEESDE